jgi:hypothetical protein
MCFRVLGISLSELVVRKRYIFLVSLVISRSEVITEFFLQKNNHNKGAGDVTHRRL